MLLTQEEHLMRMDSLAREARLLKILTSLVNGGLRERSKGFLFTEKENLLYYCKKGRKRI